MALIVVWAIEPEMNIRELIGREPKYYGQRRVGTNPMLRIGIPPNMVGVSEYSTIKLIAYKGPQDSLDLASLNIFVEEAEARWQHLQRIYRGEQFSMLFELVGDN